MTIHRLATLMLLAMPAAVHAHMANEVILVVNDHATGLAHTFTDCRIAYENQGAELEENHLEVACERAKPEWNVEPGTPRVGAAVYSQVVVSVGGLDRVWRFCPQTFRHTISEVVRGKTQMTTEITVDCNMRTEESRRLTISLDGQ